MDWADELDARFGHCHPMKQKIRYWSTRCRESNHPISAMTELAMDLAMQDHAGWLSAPEGIRQLLWNRA